MTTASLKMTFRFDRAVTENEVAEIADQIARTTIDDFGLPDGGRRDGYEGPFVVAVDVTAVWRLQP